MHEYSTVKLKRNAEAIKNIFKTTGNITTVTSDVSVIFPTRYVDRKLAILSTTAKVVGIYVIVDAAGNYAVANRPIFTELSPNVIRDVIINDVPHKELMFSKGDVFMPNNVLPMTDTFIYDLFDEFFLKGNVPWYMGYDDVANIYADTTKYVNVNIDSNPLIMEILTSIISRDAHDSKVFYRLTDGKGTPSYTGISNIYYTYSNTGAKLIGGYYGYGILNAIMDKEEKSSNVTKVLRA